MARGGKKGGGNRSIPVVGKYHSFTLRADSLLELFYYTHGDAVLLVMSGIATLCIPRVTRDSELRLPAPGGTVLLAGGHCDVHSDLAWRACWRRIRGSMVMQMLSRVDSTDPAGARGTIWLKLPF